MHRSTQASLSKSVKPPPKLRKRALMVAIPPAKSALGIAAIVLAFLSLPFALGGFVVGFFLTAVGGSLAIVWRPFVIVAGTPNGPQPPWS